MSALVTLSDVLGALGGPLEERPLWAVLQQAATEITDRAKGSSTY